MIFVANYGGMRRLGNFGEDSRKTLKAMLRMYCVEFWIGLIWFRTRRSGGILNMVINKCNMFSSSEDV
jgi:hypothetical protein